MYEAHKHLNLTNFEFNTFKQYLIECIEEFKISENCIMDFENIIEMFRISIVT